MQPFKRKLIFGSLLALLLAGVAGYWGRHGTEVHVSTQDITVNKAMRFQNKRGEVMAYRLLLPSGYRPGESNMRYPLVITLHGDGCNGSDNTRQLTQVFPAFSGAGLRKRYPCFVLAPQCPARSYWVDKQLYQGVTVQQARTPTLGTRLLLALLPSILRDYPIDPRRIYVIGYSSGGTGVWEVITRRPQLFAAAVPLCGRGDPRTVSRILHLPIWVFHGARDRVVPCACARVMVRALTRAGGHPCYTEYPDAGHDAGARALQDPALFTWLFAQKKPGSQGSRPGL